jgi:hypothetical protein
MDKVSRSGIEFFVRAHRRLDEARIITRGYAARNLPAIVRRTRARDGRSGALRVESGCVRP